jgi:triosephosphate isomerase
MQRPIFVANWKMHFGPTLAREYMAAFTARWAPHDDRTVIFCPPTVSLTTVVHTLGPRTDIGVGAQNIWTEDKGAFTGETCAPMVRDAGGRYVIVGHSERRHVFGESDAQAGLKCAAATRSGLIPILCVGELLDEREQGLTHDVVLRQLRAGIADLTPDVVASMAFAYEPVWAIGTGMTATPADASEVHAILRKAIGEVVGDGAADVPILYGGSVNTGNANALITAPGIDGLLVGGASLDVEGWAGICDT